MNHLSMSHVIQKLIPMEKNQTLSEYNKVNATKVKTSSKIVVWMKSHVFSCFLLMFDRFEEFMMLQMYYAV